MYDLDNVIDFVDAFVAAEHRALIATHTEPDDREVARLTHEAERFLHSTPGSIVSLGFGRPPGLSGAELEPLAATAGNLHRRPVYAVAAYRMGDRTVYRAFLGSHRDPEGYEYDLVLNIASVDGELRIVGEAGIDVFGPQDELVWEQLGGEQFPEMEQPEERSLLRRPGNPVHAAHFDALGMGVG